MEPRNYLQELPNKLASNTQELQRFVQETLELQRVFDALEPGSPEAIEGAALLHERRELVRQWCAALDALWDRMETLAKEVWDRQLNRWKQSLDADLATL